MASPEIRRAKRRENRERYGTPTNIAGKENRAKRKALLKKMGPPVRPNDGKDCVYGYDRDQKFCTAHLKHH